MQSDDKKDTASRKTRGDIAQPASEKANLPLTRRSLLSAGWTATIVLALGETATSASGQATSASGQATSVPGSPAQYTEQAEYWGLARTQEDMGYEAAFPTNHHDGTSHSDRLIKTNRYIRTYLTLISLMRTYLMRIESHVHQPHINYNDQNVHADTSHTDRSHSDNPHVHYDVVVGSTA